jgi:hypothetical protein
LNGDALELALADVNVAAMVFERFMELTMKPGEELFDKTIYFNPGNHDHHLWESARETQYIEEYLPSTKWGDHLDAPWHATNMFLGEYDPVPCYLLDRLLRRYGSAYEAGAQPHFFVVYPNFGLRRADGQRCVIFSHGHYIESIYRLMTGLRSTLFPDRAEPDTIWELESENFAWVDFFWSTLGRSGEFGADVPAFSHNDHLPAPRNGRIHQRVDAARPAFRVLALRAHVRLLPPQAGGWQAFALIGGLLQNRS